MSKRVLFNGALFKMYDIGIDEVVINKEDITMKVMKEDVKELLNRFDIPEEVTSSVETYMKAELPTYELVEIRRASEHPDDDYLYQVMAKNKMGYSVWTCWNQSTKSLNFGHYNLTAAEALETMDEYFHTVY